jgi:hypothetical protein
LKKGLKTKQKPKTEEAVVETKPNMPEKQVFNADGKMVFTKFDFSELGSEKDRSKKGEKNPKKILENIAKQKEKIEKLEQENKKEQANQLKEKQTWQTALKKIQGIKVKDDPELLRKTIRKDQQIKKQSAKKWKDRQRNVKKEIAEKQQKRNENINKKKEQKKSAIRKKNIKKGRIVPGF